MRLRQVTPFPQRIRHRGDPRSEKNLAVAILRQAWHEAVLDLTAVKETSRKDHRLLKKKAAEWISSDEDGFPYWCELASVDYHALRQKLFDTLHLQHQDSQVKALSGQNFNNQIELLP